MPRATRASAKASSQPSSQDPAPASSPKAAGSKRKASGTSAPQSKRGKKANDEPKEQMTLEQSMPGNEEVAEELNNQEDMGKAQDEDASMQDVGNETKEEPAKEEDDKIEQQAEEKKEALAAEKPQQNGAAEKIQALEEKIEKLEEKKDEPADAKPKENGHAETEEKAEEKLESTADSKMDDTGAVHKTKDDQDGNAAATNGDGAIESSQGRGEKMPSNMLEKGIVYFFMRGRVGIDDPASVQDVARSYIVLRPLPQNAKLTDGALDDLKNNRLLALPKKVLPRSHRDAFMTFVEKAGVGMDVLKEEFMQGSTYSTQTTGVRHQPAVTPIGEGVYSIVTTGRESHLAYMLTIPGEIGAVQEEMGLAPQGSFVLSTKNPEQKGPANASLPEGPGYPKEIMDEFRGLRWMPTQPKHLNYSNAQLLLIGEGHGELRKAVQAEEKDENDDKKETPLEEMEKLEEEDEHRVEGLHGDDTVFDDLKISHKDYPKVQTTW